MVCVLGVWGKEEVEEGEVKAWAEEKVEEEVEKREGTGACILPLGSLGVMRGGIFVCVLYEENQDRGGQLGGGRPRYRSVCRVQVGMRIRELGWGGDRVGVVAAIALRAFWCFSVLFGVQI